MLNIWFWILIPFNLIHLISHIIYNLTSSKIIYALHEMWKRGQTTGENLVSEFKDKPLLTKIMLMIILVLILVILIIILVPWIWIPIIVNYVVGSTEAVFTFVVIFSGYTLLSDYLMNRILKKQNKSLPQIFILNDSLSVLSLLIICIWTVSGFNFDLDNMMFSIMQNNISYNIFYATLYPVILYSIMITNSYLVLKRVWGLISKKTNMKIVDILLLFASSGVVGLIYLQNVDISQFSEDIIDQFYRNVSIVQMLFTSLVIPLLIRKLFDNKNLQFEIDEQYGGK